MKDAFAAIQRLNEQRVETTGYVEIINLSQTEDFAPSHVSLEQLAAQSVERFRTYRLRALVVIAEAPKLLKACGYFCSILKKHGIPASAHTPKHLAKQVAAQPPTQHHFNRATQVIRARQKI